MPNTGLQTKRFRTGHVIEEYSVRNNTIVCACSWKGDADVEWKLHKHSMKDEPKVTGAETLFQKGHRKRINASPNKS